MPLTPEQAASAALPGAFQAIVLPLLWALGWWGLSRAGWVRHWALRLLLVVAWMFVGAFATGSKVHLGIPMLVDFTLFPLLPFTVCSEYRDLAMDAGMDALEASRWSQERGWPPGLALALHAFAMHWFLWIGPRRAAATSGSRNDTVTREELGDIAQRIISGDPAPSPSPSTAESSMKDAATRQEMGALAERIISGDAPPPGTPPAAGAPAHHPLWWRAVQMLLATALGAGTTWLYHHQRAQAVPMAPGQAAAAVSAPTPPAVPTDTAAPPEAPSAAPQMLADDSPISNKENLLEAATLYAQAFARGDYAAVAAMMPKEDVEANGGNGATAIRLEYEVKRRGQPGHQLLNVEVGDACALAKIPYGVVALVPTAFVYEVEGSSTPRTLTGYLLGFSRDEGATWAVQDHHMISPAEIRTLYAPLTTVTDIPEPGQIVASPPSSEPPPGMPPAPHGPGTGQPPLPPPGAEAAAAGLKEPTQPLRHLDAEVLEALKRDSSTFNTLEFLTRRAKDGDAVAKYVLATRFSNIWGNDSQAPLTAESGLHYLRSAAAQGLPQAQLRVAHYSLFGEGGAMRDLQEYRRWLERAAEQEPPEALWMLAVVLMKGTAETPPDYPAGFKTLRRAAERGYPDAQHTLGYSLLDGSKITPDRVQALHWLKLAAEQGHLPAQGLYGAQLYLHDRNKEEALRWLHLAASYGDSLALESLGTLAHGRSKTDPKMKIEACKWYRLAAKQSDNKLGQSLAKLEATMTRAQRAEAASQAAAYQFKIIPADESGGTDASYTLKPVASGLGFFIREDGYMLTPLHLVKAGTRIRVRGLDGIYAATLVEGSEETGLALLKVQGAFSALSLDPDPDPTVQEAARRLEGELPKVTLALVTDIWKSNSADPHEVLPCQPDTPGLALTPAQAARADGAPVFDSLGQLLGMVRTPQPPARGPAVIQPVVLPRPLPQPTGTWATDRNWRRSLSIAERSLLSANACMAVLVFE